MKLCYFHIVIWSIGLPNDFMKCFTYKRVAWIVSKENIKSKHHDDFYCSTHKETKLHVLKQSTKVYEKLLHENFMKYYG
jgi:hypothetical protein